MREWYLVLKERYKRIIEKGKPLDRDGNEIQPKDTSGEQSQAEDHARSPTPEKKGRRVHGDKELGIESYYALPTEENDYQD